MKFVLLYELGGDIKQYRNLKNWLDHKGIEYKFEWSDTGRYVADILIIDDEQDATYFSLVFTHGAKKV